MKQLLVCTILFAGLTATAQQKKAPVKKPVAKTTAPVSTLKTLNDSASYAIGLSVANFYKQQGITKLNGDAVAKAINDAITNKKLLLTDMEANSVMMRYMNQAQTAKAQPTIEAGEKFLTANKTKAGVKTTASGLQYEVIKEGTGPKPGETDSVVCHYKGTLLDGTQFDNSYDRGQPITFTVNGVIKGWTEALQLMPAGSKYKLYIPHELAYGVNEVGNIPAGSLLIFEVELLEVKKK
jgi:FKBP-type peptidyl-prolyl cis-trans isomerase